MLIDNKYTPATIGDLTFNIPLYQRMFRWGEDQILLLLSDLYREFYELREYLSRKDVDEEAKKKAEEQAKYYIGMLTVHRNRYGDYDLIDGQQRFTVLMLIGIAFHGTDWDRFVKCNSKPRLSFFARPQSSSYIEKAIETGGEDLSLMNSSENEMMSNGIKIIKTFLKSKEKECKIKGFEINDFSAFIFNKLTFFVSELPETYSPTELNEYFEAMNSAGKGLENFDILKVDLLKGRKMDKSLYIKLWDIVSKMEKRLHPHWISESNVNYNAEDDRKIMMQQIIKLQSILANSNYDDVSEILSVISNSNSQQQESGKVLLNIDAKEHKLDSEERDNERSVIKFPELLLFTLKMHSPDAKTSDYYNTSFLLDRFIPLTGGKRIVNGESISYLPASDNEIKKFYVELLYYRFLIDYYIVRIKGRNEARKYSSLFTKSLSDGDRFNTNLSNRLNMYQAMLSVSTTWHLWLTPAIEWIQKNLSTDAKGFLDFLKKDDNLRHEEIPTSTSLRFDHCKERYWYWRLDYYLWEKYVDKENPTELDRKIEKAYKTYVFRANRSIEHFHPQNEEFYEEKWGDNVNIFGNLALISSEFNSTQSNDSFADKMSRIENRMNSGITESLKLAEMFRIAKSQAKWSYELALIHESEMLNILKESFSNI